MNFSKVLPWLMVVLYSSMCLHIASGNDFNVAPNGGDDLSVINPAYYQFAHSHGSEEELLDMDWNTHFRHHEKGIAHTHMDHLFGSSQKSIDKIDHADINSGVFHQPVDNHDSKHSHKHTNIPEQSMSFDHVSGSTNSKPVIQAHDSGDTLMNSNKHSQVIFHEQNTPSVQPEVINMEYYQFGHKHNVLEYDMNMNQHTHVHHNGMNADFAPGQHQSFSSDRLNSLGSTMPKPNNGAKYGSAVVEKDKKHPQDYQSKGYYSNQNQGNYHATNTKYQFSSEVNGQPKHVDSYNHVTKNQYKSNKNSVMQSHDQMKTSHGSGDSQISDKYSKGYDHGSSDKGVHTMPYTEYECPRFSEQKQTVDANTKAVGDTQIHVVGSGIAYVPVEHIQVSQSGLKRNVAPSYGDSRRSALSQKAVNYDTQSDYYHQMDMDSI